MSIFDESEYSRIEKILDENIFVNPDIGDINNIVHAEIFVISMPKCATSSIQWGLERLGHKVIHAHNNMSTFNAFSNGAVLKDNDIGLEALIALRQHRNQAPAFFFCGYREPVSWYLSMAGHFGVPLDDELANKIVENIVETYPWKNYSFVEAQGIVAGSTGLRLLDREFDADAGYSVFRNGNTTSILYRFDRMSELGDYILNAIDDRFEMRQERRNESPDYTGFVRNFRLPYETLAELYSSDLHQYFYREHETRKLIERFGS